jgi:hypothetical protein
MAHFLCSSKPTANSHASTVSRLELPPAAKYPEHSHTQRPPSNSNFFFYLATPGLLCQPRVIMKMIVQSMMGCRLAGETEFSEKTCPSATFVQHKIPRAHQGLNPCRRSGKPATNRLSYGAAQFLPYSYGLFT